MTFEQSENSGIAFSHHGVGNREERLGQYCINNPSLFYFGGGGHVTLTLASSFSFKERKKGEKN